MFAAARLLIFPLMLLHHGSALFLDQDCVKNIDDLTNNPWMALITTDTQHCFGTLIDNQHVITAAQCLENTAHALVRLGDFNSQDSRMFEDYYVKSAFIHNLFNERSNSNNRALNDIALLRLQRKVVYKPSIKPICLILDDKTKIKLQNVQNYSAILYGNRYEAPRRVFIERLHPNKCYDLFQSDLRESQICGASKDKIKCGETGSPLVKRMNLNGISYFALLGFHNYGPWDTCVYTNVVNYIDWIVENILDVEPVVPGN